MTRVAVLPLNPVAILLGPGGRTGMLVSMIDTALPHVPYVTAVAGAIAELRLAEATYDHESDDVIVMEAVLTGSDGYVLAWRQTTGWVHGPLEDGVLSPTDATTLTTATVPPPDQVAAAWAAPGPGPHPCEESEPARGLLPEALATAVAEADLDEETGARLAAYTLAAR